MCLQAIGPHDVLATLLNNLKVQERQLRVCTTVAIAIVAETCAPFTVLPAIMNEYRVPEINVQNGVLKALSFMFEVFFCHKFIDFISLMDLSGIHITLSNRNVKHKSPNRS